MLKNVYWMNQLLCQFCLEHIQDRFSPIFFFHTNFYCFPHIWSWPLFLKNCHWVSNVTFQRTSASLVSSFINCPRAWTLNRPSYSLLYLSIPFIPFTHFVKYHTTNPQMSFPHFLTPYCSHSILNVILLEILIQLYFNCSFPFQTKNSLQQSYF